MKKIKLYVVYNVTDYQNTLAVSLTRKGAENFMNKYPNCGGWIEEIMVDENYYEFPDY